MNIGAEVREIIAESPISKQLESVPDVVPVGDLEPVHAAEPIVAEEEVVAVV